MSSVDQAEIVDCNCYDRCDCLGFEFVSDDDVEGYLILPTDAPLPPACAAAAGAPTDRPAPARAAAETALEDVKGHSALRRHWPWPVRVWAAS